MGIAYLKQKSKAQIDMKDLGLAFQIPRMKITLQLSTMCDVAIIEGVYTQSPWMLQSIDEKAIEYSNAFTREV